MKKLNKRSFRNFCLFTLLTFTGLLIAPISVLGGDLPAGPDIKIGDPSISTVDKTMNINAGQYDKTWIDWQGGFNIGTSNTVNNIGPSAAAAMLHNDVSGSISSIQGILNGNCNVFLLNPNGIIFSSTAQVNVGGLVTSTLMMSQDDFLSGNYIFTSGALENPGFIINEGTINAFGEAGVSMLGGAVKNVGTIKADLGTVNLISGSEVTLNVSGDGSIQAAVNAETLNNVYDEDGNRVTVGVENLGAITADGGEIRIEVGAVQDVFDTLINQEGVVRAGSMVEKDGKIILISKSEGIVQNSGTLDASAVEDGAKGGTVQVLGEKVGLFDQAKIDVSGDLGGGTVLIGGDFQGKNLDIMNASRTYVGSDVTITADALSEGDGGTVIVWSDEYTQFYGNISARGGSESGDGGFVEVSGKESLAYFGTVDLRGPHGEVGTLLLDPNEINITTATGTDNAYLGSGTPDIAFADDPHVNGIMDITAAALVTQLDSAAVILQANTQIDVETTVNASGNTNSFGLELDTPTVNFSNGADITLKNATLTIGNTKAGNVVLLEGATVTLSTGLGAGNIVIAGSISGTALGVQENLTLISGAGTTTVTGAVGAGGQIGTLTLQADNALAVGAVTFNGDVTATALTTFARGYAVIFNEDATITTDANFLNTNGVTLGNAADDALLFTGGLGSIAGTTTAAGTITTTDTNIDIAALTITDTTTITTGAATVGDLALTGTVAGTSADDLTLVSGAGTTTVTGAVGAGGQIGTLTLQADNALAVGAVTFNGDVTATALTTFARGYAVIFNEDATITTDANFLNTNGVTLGNAADDALLFTGGLGSIAGTTTAAGTITTTDTNIDIAALTITDTTTITTGAATVGDLALTGTVAGTSADDLTLVSGAGTTTVTGAVGAGGQIGTLTLQADNALAVGAVTFNGDVTATALTTFARGYAVIFNEDATITTDANFLNTNGVTLGNAADDALLFTGGLGSIAGTTTAAGTITTTDTNIDIAALTITDTTTITTGAATVGDLALTGTVAGTSADDLTLVSGAGTTTVTGAVGAGGQIGTLTLQADNALAVGAVTFNGDVTATALTTFARGYAVIFNEDATITTDANFLNTNGVTLGNAADDALLFTGGLGSIAGTTTAAGTITTTDTNIDIAALTITDTTTITTGAATVGDLALTGTVAGTSADDLTLVSGAGTTTVTGAVGAGGQIGTLTLQADNALAVGAVTFNGDVTATALTTFARGYAVIFNEDATITTDANFLNTNGVTLGNAADDALLFTGGLGSIAGTTTAAGTITTTDTNIDIAALTITDTTTITTGAATVGDLALTGTVAGTSADDLTLVSGAGTTTVTGAVGAGGQIGTLTLQADNALAVGAVTFNGDVTATALTTFARGYAVIFNEDATITTDANFLNTNGVTLGNAADDALLFTGGLGSIAGTTTAAGTITTTDTNIDIAALTITDTTTITTGAATVGDLALTGTVAGTSADDLTLVSGAGTTTVTGAVGAGGQIGTLTLQADNALAVGAVTFNGDVTATAPYDLCTELSYHL